MADLDLSKELSLEDRLKQAEGHKEEGNDHFRAKEYDQALFAYQRGLETLPLRPQTPKVDHEEEEEKEEQSERVPEATAHETTPSKTETTPDDVQRSRSILNSNIAACHVKLGDDQRAVDSCTQALKDDPKYIKALQRRASSNESIDTWSSLSSAQDGEGGNIEAILSLIYRITFDTDYNTLLSILPDPSPQRSETQKSLRLLRPRLEVAQKKETGEMLDKLKGIGNNVLGHFGLSTDNFKFEPNGQGGYSVNFSR